MESQEKPKEGSEPKDRPTDSPPVQNTTGHSPESVPAHNVGNNPDEKKGDPNPTPWKHLKYTWKGERRKVRLSVVLEGIIALCTIIIVGASGYQLILQRDYNKKALRAYVDIHSVVISPPEPGKPLKATWEIRNSGQTPALELQTPISSAFGVNLPVNAIKMIYRLQSGGGLKGGFPLNPGTSRRDSTIDFGIPLPDSLGERTVYLAGVIFYKDVFDLPITQEFVFCYDHFQKRTIRLTREDYGYDGNAD